MSSIRLDTPADLSALMGIDFSAEQLAAITAELAPGVIIAGAGSGKTTVMAARVVWLVGRGFVEPQQVLGLTFTRKAAGELADRIQAALALLQLDDILAATVTTYDGFASHIVAEFGDWVGLPSSTSVLADAQRYVVADKVVRSATEAGTHLGHKSISSITKDVVALESAARAHLLDDDQIQRWTTGFLTELDAAPLYRGKAYRAVVDAQRIGLARLDLIRLCSDYRDAKGRAGLVEFGDQMAAAVDLAQRLPLVGATLRARFALVVVDEFQDTSVAQTRMLSHLFGAAGQIRDYPVTAVGDPMQAIYTWRGAAADNMATFHHSFPASKPATYTLSINRRSGAEILRAANAVAEPVRRELAAKDPAVVELTPGAGAPRAEITIHESVTWQEETQWIADRLLDDHRVGRLNQWSDAVILVRRNREAGPIFHACASRGVPVVVQELGGLLFVPAVAQVFAMMKMVVDDQANPEVVEVLSGPRFGLGPHDLEAIGSRARQLAREASDDIGRGDPGRADIGFDDTGDAGTHHGDAAAGSSARGHASDDGGVDRGTGMGTVQLPVRLLAAVIDPGAGAYSPHAVACLARLTHDLTVLRGFNGSLVDHVRRVIAQIGLDVEVYASQADSQGQVRQFLGHVVDFGARQPEAGLSALVAYLEAEATYSSGLSRAGTDPGDAVAIMTVHRAKGLEWDTVVLPAMVDHVFPSDRLSDNPIKTPAALPTAVRSDAAGMPQLREVSNDGLKVYEAELREALAGSEDRLAYVAITRAKRQLVMTCHRWRAGAVRAQRRSRYVDAVADLAGEGSPITVSWLDGEDADLVPIGESPIRDWPTPPDLRWAEARQIVDEAALGHRMWPDADRPPEVQAAIDTWDEQIAILQSEREARSVVSVPVPAPLSTSQLARLRSLGPEQFAARLARPVPSPPSGRTDLGVRFHAWVEQYYSLSPIPQVFRPTHGGRELARLCDRFLSGRFAAARPLGVEVEFVTTIAAVTVSGRIDAVFRAEENPGLVPKGKAFLIVDWKTGHRPADEVQLWVYAMAWAAASSVPLDQVAAGFYYVARDTLAIVDDHDSGQLVDLVASLDEQDEVRDSREVHG
ncbi:MAG: ATP-dependent helicase [Propionibacteriaceae bacterium]|jgi:DNA helicase-2/ATP-dependent DNA helicase PcrA|nr:ATP-dependent helicase [Propionibacteriaceae bacterium]